MLEFLTSKGADVCLVAMPLTTQVHALIAGSVFPKNFEAAQLFYHGLTNAYGITYVDMSSAITDDNLFVQNHLNVEGALKFAPTLESACFGSPQND